MLVKQYCKTGHIHIIKEDLTISVNRFNGKYSRIKIGITNNPDKRWYDHRRNDTNWSKMILLYESSSINYVKEIERFLVEKHWENDYCWNRIGGGGGNYGFPPYFVYLLVESFK